MFERFLASACWLLVLLVARPLYADGPGDVSLNAEQRAAVASAAANFMTRSGTAAVSIYVDRGGATSYAAGFGVTDLEHDVAARADSVYAIGSITKSFTAHAVLQLVAEGKVDLDAPIRQYLTDYQGPGGAATVRQLLVHTSGIPNYVNEIPGIAPQLRRSEMQRPELRKVFESRPLAFAPGTQWSYSNSGYYLLGLLVEAASGRDYYDYLRESVLAPLGIKQIYTGDDRQVIARRAIGYEKRPEGFIHATPWYYLVPFSAGSLLSTAEEVAHYRRATFKSAAMSPKVRELMTSGVPFADGSANQYLLGALIRSDFDGMTKYAHSGEIWGYSAAHAYYPQQDVTVVILTNNKGQPTAVSLERKVARIVLGLPARPARDEKLTPKELSRYVGEYRFAPYRIGVDLITFQARDGRLMFGYGTDGKNLQPLLYQGGGRFVFGNDDESEFVFQQPRDGAHAKSVFMNSLNSSMPAQHVDSSRP
jgi:CubicO group peptidase (beta-lactamase class C family)